MKETPDKKTPKDPKPEEVDARAMLEALRKNEKYAGKNPEDEDRKHTEDSERP